MAIKTVGDLIRELQQYDENLPVCINNAEIFETNCGPAYYDGALQRLDLDPKHGGFYNVVGAKYVYEGKKVWLMPHSIHEALLDNPELPVEFIGMTPATEERFRASTEARREQVRKMDAEIEAETLCKSS